MSIRTRVVSKELIDVLTLDEIRNHCRVDDGLDTDILKVYELAAYDMAEGFLNTYLSKVLLDASLDEWEPKIFLPWGEAQEPESITALGVDGSREEVDFTYNPIEESVVIGSEFMNHRDFQFSYEAGLTVVPDTIKVACLMIIGTLYKNRENNITGTQTAEVPLPAQVLLSRYARTYI